jgi:hypothetical protein
VVRIMDVQIVDSKAAPQRGMRKAGSYTSLLRRLQQGKTGVITFESVEDAKKAQFAIRQAARKAGISVETYRPREEAFKVCVTRMSDSFLGDNA